ncbi:MAG: IS66 family transposase [Planctomycetes bacterium]|nr:IS66 family transposase [Planctomycetota bacterium]
MGRPHPPHLPEDHHCEWRQEAEALRDDLDETRAELGKLRDEFDVLKRHVFGRRSEKMPPVAQELRVGAPRAPAQARRSEVRAEAPTVTFKHKVPDDKRRCPSCGGTDLRQLGAGEVSVAWEYVPARIERHVHIREKLTCRCGEGIVVANAPPKPYDKSHYGPALMAHVVVAKCADSMPLYRLEKGFQRAGIPIARSTMVELFHRTAELLAPLSRRILDHVAAHRLVHADETPLRVLAPRQCRRGFLWTFLTDDLVGYRFSPDRSGKTPVEVLGGTRGDLVVDLYTGYNAVTEPAGRRRVGCWAHVRRKFFDAKSGAPRADEVLALILDLYRVEEEAKKLGLGTDAHRALRDAKSRAVCARIRTWLEEQRNHVPPRSALGVAIAYALKQWAALTRFLDDPTLPLDNNAAERALRVAALGRKNFLFVGNDQAGDNLAGLYSLVATCQLHGVNPEEYLADVLIRVQTHPQQRIDELLPHRWPALRAPPAGGADAKAPQN